MVQKMYGPQIENEALNQFVRNQFLEAVDKEKLKIELSKFENMKYDGKSSVAFDALVEVFPDIELKGFEGLEFKKDEVLVSDEEVESLKKNYLESKSEMLEVQEEGAEVSKGTLRLLTFKEKKKMEKSLRI